jgi:hypothetical protein
MAGLKTQRTDAGVEEFLNSVEHEGKRADSFALLKLMREVTGEEPAMWGPSIVGFGSYHYKYASGREGEWMLVGFSPRKRDLTGTNPCWRSWASTEPASRACTSTSWKMLICLPCVN